MVDPFNVYEQNAPAIIYLTFCHLLRQCHTALSAPYPLLPRESSSVYKRKVVQKSMKTLIQSLET
ncbi:Hypothetical protein FKW44_018499 [Caligus rogercresseyi]|uniref:Uncharacterized protein n=1 Tax=Caligus rogercresseyi TaxID=217165 RepID=A0A7T8GUI4_CALRO|nr:Hypothetical protein FKW44_018499 [Caligus rogercresseyi]